MMTGNHVLNGPVWQIITLAIYMVENSIKTFGWAVMLSELSVNIRDRYQSGTSWPARLRNM